MSSERRQLAVLYDLSSAIVGVRGTKEVCERILKIATRALGVSKASIMKYDPSTRSLKIVAARGLPAGICDKVSIKIGEGVSGHVFKSSRPVLIRDITSSPFKPRKRYATTSLISAPVTSFPMRMGPVPIGVINMTDKMDGTPFTREDLRLLTTIANQTAAYLHLSDMVDEVRRSEAMRRELDLAREIQTRLLPKRGVRRGGLDIGGKCLVAGKVGGDYFDFIGVDQPAVVVADVAGHSIGASLTMSSFRTLVRSGHELDPPSLMAGRLNRLLFDDLKGSDQFISMVYLQFLEGAVICTTAGHHGPLVLRNSTFREISSGDPLLGIKKDESFHETRVNIKKGDVIVVYTDGLVDAVPLGNVKQIVKAGRNLSSSLIVGRIMAEVKTDRLRDDATVVVVKVTEGYGRLHKVT